MRLDEKISKETDAEIKEMLEIMGKAARLKIENYKKEMETKFYEEAEKKERFSIIGRPIQYAAQYRVDARSGLSEEIEEAIKGLFHFDRHSLCGALQTMVIAALSDIFGTVQAGEQELEEFFIVPYFNAILRVDIRAWRYNFSAQGVVGTVQNAFSYIVSKSIINYDLLTEGELVYFVTEGLRDAPLSVVKDYIKELKEIWALVKGFDQISDARHSHAANQIAQQPIYDWELL